MNKEFVPYEQALALKELGFDEPCFVYWVFDGVKTTLSTSHNKSGWSMIGFKNNQMAKKAGLCTALLYQQAFRWLLALANKDKHFTNKWTISYNEDYYSLFLGGCNMGVFEAELECLKKLIEIVKENVDKQR
jgi:hypothetical protein